MVTNMLDIKFIREHPEAVENDLKKRGLVNLVTVLNDLIKSDTERRALIARADELRSQRNAITREIAGLKKQGKSVSSKMKSVKDIPEEISDIELRLKTIEDSCRAMLMKLPNILHESVPEGKSDADNVEERKWGKHPKFDFEPRGHEELAIGIDGLDIERAAKITGARFYFLKNELVILNNAVLRFALDMLVKRGYSPVQPPFMMRRALYEGVTDMADFENVMYKIENEDAYLIATSEHPLIAMHSDEVFDSNDLPKRYVGISTCFRTEAGSHGKDTKGVFRVHQFDKVEQIIFSRPEISWKLHEELIANSEAIFQALEIPYRIVNVCTGDIGMLAAKKYDLEAWLPTQQRYREMCSCSNIKDFQARRLGIRWREKEGKAPAGFVHTLNNTGIATPRAIVAILENFQQEDGSVRIPKALWQYTGFKEILPKKQSATK
jgi:seryl-tRNA synthetase